MKNSRDQGVPFPTIRWRVRDLKDGEPAGTPSSPLSIYPSIHPLESTLPPTPSWKPSLPGPILQSSIFINFTFLPLKLLYIPPWNSSFTLKSLDQHFMVELRWREVELTAYEPEEERTIPSRNRTIFIFLCSCCYAIYWSFRLNVVIVIVGGWWVRYCYPCCCTTRHWRNSKEI